MMSWKLNRSHCVMFFSKKKASVNLCTVTGIQLINCFTIRLKILNEVETKDLCMVRYCSNIKQRYIYDRIYFVVHWLWCLAVFPDIISWQTIYIYIYICLQTGVGKVSDHGTIGPRKFFEFPENICKKEKKIIVEI